MEKKYLYYQAITQFKVEIKEDGTVGRPIYIKGFTSPINDSYKTRKVEKAKVVEAKKKQQEEMSISERSEVVEL